MIKRAFAFGIFSFLISNSPLVLADDDILGIKLGMSIDDAKAKLGPEFKFAAMVTPKPIKEYRGGWAAKGSHIVTMEEYRGHLVYISNYEQFTDTTRPSANNVRNALIAKYGQPTGTTGQTMYWVYPEPGKLGKASDQNPNCIANFEPPNLTSPSTPELNQLAPGAGGEVIGFPMNWRSGCVAQIAADFHDDRLWVRALDSGNMYNIAHASAEQAKQKQQAVESQNKPKL